MADLSFDDRCCLQVREHVNLHPPAHTTPQYQDSKRSARTGRTEAKRERGKEGKRERGRERKEKREKRKDKETKEMRKVKVCTPARVQRARYVRVCARCRRWWLRSGPSGTPPFLRAPTQSRNSFGWVFFLMSSLSTRTPHGAHVWGATRNRIDPHRGEIEQPTPPYAATCWRHIFEVARADHRRGVEG